LGAQSLLERLDGLSIGKSRFEDPFSADELNEMWTFTDHGGVGSGVMDDSLHGGYKITTGAVNGNSSSINHNDINHYSEVGCILIAEVKKPDSASSVNMTLNEQITNELDTFIEHQNDTAQTFQRLRTRRNSGTAISTSTSIADNTIYNNVKLQLRAATGLLWLEGDLEAINTGSSLPDVPLQPLFYALTRASATKNGHVRNMEVYNTA